MEELPTHVISIPRDAKEEDEQDELSSIARINPRV